MNFTHLHVHTEFSLLDGSSKISEIAVQAKRLGFDSLAITDHGVMYGAVDFYRACREAGIKPIIGCEIYVCLVYTELLFECRYRYNSSDNNRTYNEASGRSFISNTNRYSSFKGTII